MRSLCLVATFREINWTLSSSHQSIVVGKLPLAFSAGESVSFLHGWQSCCCVCSRQGAMPTLQRVGGGGAETHHLWDVILSILKLSVQYGVSAPCQCPVKHVRFMVYFLLFFGGWVSL